MTHKFGIHVLKTIKEALDLDKENGNPLVGCNHEGDEVSRHCILHPQ